MGLFDSIIDRVKDAFDDDDDDRRSSSRKKKDRDRDRGGIFDSVVDTVGDVVGGISDFLDRSGGASSGGSRDRSRNSGSAWGYDVSRRDDGMYVYTSPNGTKVTTHFSPDQIVQKQWDGYWRPHPILQTAANTRGVNLGTHTVGGRVLGTDEVNARYFGKYGYSPLDTHYRNRYMNPWEFSDALGRESSGGDVDWDKEGQAGEYSPIPEDWRRWQDYLDYLDQQPQQPQQPQYPYPPYPYYPYPYPYPQQPQQPQQPDYSQQMQQLQQQLQMMQQMLDQYSTNDPWSGFFDRMAQYQAQRQAEADKAAKTMDWNQILMNGGLGFTPMRPY